MNIVIPITVDLYCASYNNYFVDVDWFVNADWFIYGFHP